MHSSKLIRLFIFCSLLIICILLLNFLLVPYSSLQKKFDAYHETAAKGNIDFIVLGSSQEGDGIKADVIDEETGMHSFVFSPQGGFPESSYLLLLDAASTNTIKTAVVGWDILQNLQTPQYIYPHREEIYRELLPDSKHDPLLRKLVLKGIADQRYTVTFFEYASFPENLTDIPAVLKSKFEPEEKVSDIPVPIDILHLTAKGDPFNYKNVLDRSYTDILYADDIEYMKKIADFAKEKSINLYVISCPLPDCIISALPKAASMQKVSADLFKSLGITYIDGCDQTVFPGSTADKNFKDCFGHLISPYCEIYTKLLCNYIKQHQEK